jgi:hypothetical protein
MRKLEQIEQKKLVRFLTLKKIFHFAVKNESGTSFQGNGKFIGGVDKQMGKKKGVSDLVVMLDDKTLFIEMKRCREVLKSGELSTENLLKPEQKEFLECVNGFSYAKGFVAYGFLEAKEIIENELNSNPLKTKSK